jgi:predicted metal-dependent phosphoesterase TrpH
MVDIQDMNLKTNLHFHTKEDPLDIISYTLFEGIDKAAELGFNVLASTCHTKNVCLDHHVQYAAEKGILLIPGIEADIYEQNSTRRNHVLILNCDATANNIHTFEDLKQYRLDHPDIFIIAAHPYFYGNFSLGDRLETYIDLFDAIELSWFYTTWSNRNRKAAEMAEKYSKPFIATSDTHFFSFMNTNFSTINAKHKTVESLFDAIRAGNYENTTSPRSLFDIFGIFGYHQVVMELAKMKRKFASKTRENLQGEPAPVFIEKDYG